MRSRIVAWALLIVLAALGSQAAAQQALPLRIALNVNVSNLPLMLAYEEGIYKKNGLDVVQFVRPSDADEMKQSGIVVNPEFIKEGGSLPLAQGNGFAIVYGRNTNANSPLDRVMIATIEQVVRYHIVAQPEITRVEQLKGKRLGVSSHSSASGFAALVVAQKMGWDPIRDIAIMANGAGMESLKDRRVDAVIASEFRYSALAANGYKSILTTDSWNVPTAGSGWVTTRKWLRDNRETASRFIRSLVEGTAIVKRSKEKTLRAMTKWWGITDTRKLDELYAAALLLPSKPYPSMEGFQKAFELHPSAETRRYKAEDLYDDSFLRELDKSGFIDALYK
jgi:NitT/TauT family transport system substrate-binding protein